MDRAVEQIIDDYNKLTTFLDSDTNYKYKYDDDSEYDKNYYDYGITYDEFIYFMKEDLQKHITTEIIKAAWDRLGGDESRLEINSKKIKIPIQRSYVEKIENEEVKNYILKNISTYNYGLSVDRHVFIDGKFIFGVECKAYAENAMIKRILIDFHLLKTCYPKISCYLFQLESQLGGDYSKLPENPLGAKPTHSIMSYIEDVNLNIFTFLKGERNIGKPIHKYFKPLEEMNIEKAINLFMKDFSRYI